jgi:hypothetical protein
MDMPPCLRLYSFHCSVIAACFRNSFRGYETGSDKQSAIYRGCFRNTIGINAIKNAKKVKCQSILKARYDDTPAIHMITTAFQSSFSAVSS